MDNRKMQQMMKQMGIEMQDIDAQEIVIKTPEEDLVFSADAEVQRMDAQGQQTYTIVGEPESRPKGEGGSESDTEPETESIVEESDGDSGGVEIEDADVELVAQRAGVPEDDAREALEAEDGDLAAAVARLE